MKCENCKTVNILKADYCKACGYHFTQKDKDNAYNKTIFGVIDNIANLKSYITLDFITGNKWFKAASLLIIVLYSFIVFKINGNQLRILDSRDYDIEYNKTTKEYYLLTDKKQVGLELYIPEKAENITVITVDNNDTAVDTTIYKTADQVTLTYSSNNHYIIQTDKQQLELFVIME